MPEQFWSPLVHGVLTCCEIYIIRPKQWNSFCLLMAFEDVEKWTHLIRGREFQTVHFFCWIWCQNYVPCFIHAIWISNWSGQMGWRPLMCYKFTMSSRLPRRLKHFIERADVAKREIRIQNLHTSWLSFKKTVLRSENQYHKITTFYHINSENSKWVGFF